MPRHARTLTPPYLLPPQHSLQLYRVVLADRAAKAGLA